MLLEVESVPSQLLLTHYVERGWFGSDATSQKHAFRVDRLRVGRIDTSPHIKHRLQAGHAMSEMVYVEIAPCDTLPH